MPENGPLPEDLAKADRLKSLSSKPTGSLEIAGFGLWLGAESLIEGLDLSIAGGDIVTLMGASGSGKSSVLAWITGALPRAFKASGHLRLHGVDITGMTTASRRIGIQFQDDLLFPHLTVAQNLGFGLSAHVQGHERRDRIEAALMSAGLAGMADRDPATLSGGQRARAALLRTLLSEPLALLLDEPFNRLDAQLREDFRAFVFEHSRRQKLPTLLVSHDEADARAAGGRVIRLETLRGSSKPAAAAVPVATLRPLRS